MKKLFLLLSIISLSSLCFAEAKSDDIDISKIKNNIDGIDATFEVKYAGITKKLAPNKTVTIYNVGSNRPKACRTNKFGEFTCEVDLYYDGEKLNISFEPEKAQYKISEIIEENS